MRVHAPEKKCCGSRQPDSGRFAPRGFANRAEDKEIAGEHKPFPLDFDMTSLPLYPPVQAKLDEGSAGDDQRNEEAASSKGTWKMALATGQVQPEVNRQEPNRTGMPDRLKAGIESLSGIDMSDVRVHANSPKPAGLNALAYTQGNQIYLGPGQERYLPHEAWHAVQQKQGRVRPTMHIKGIDVNDNAELEREADAMDGRVSQFEPTLKSSLATFSPSAVRQLFTAPPPAFPPAGQRNHTLTGGVPTESHVTTRHGSPNDLIGSPPSVNILGWQHILTVGASGPWVRFHLVNENVGGLGNQGNLVPTSHATNHCAPWNSFENRIKSLESAQTGIHVTVDVTYPPAIGGAVPGTLASVSHYYPTNISARVYYWNPVTNSYILDLNQPNFAPFPLQPPAVAGVTDLSQQTVGWVGMTLMGGFLTDAQANIFWDALRNGTVDQYRNESNEPTPEMQLLDALDSVGTVDCRNEGYVRVGGGSKRRRSGETPGHRVPNGSRIQILNGVYRLP